MILLVLTGRAAFATLPSHVKAIYRSFDIFLRPVFCQHLPHLTYFLHMIIYQSVKASLRLETIPLEQGLGVTTTTFHNFEINHHILWTWLDATYTLLCLPLRGSLRQRHKHVHGPWWVWGKNKPIYTKRDRDETRYVLHKIKMQEDTRVRNKTQSLYQLPRIANWRDSYFFARRFLFKRHGLLSHTRQLIIPPFA